MSWQHDSFLLKFLPVEDEVEVIIGIGQELHDSLPPDVRSRFRKTGSGYRYQRLNIQDVSSEKVEYALSDDKKLVGSGKPSPISLTGIAKVIKTQTVIFYTGAGISASCVPVMAKLEQDLGITDMEAKRNYSEFIVKFLKDIDSYVKIMQSFFHDCIHAAPSVAHESLKKIVEKYGHILCTENIDQLHQKTGLDPVIMPGRQNDALIKYVKLARYIITIGLSMDDGGFLKYCKRVNPSIQIISINLCSPCYLSDKDFTLIGDVQKIMPKLLSLLEASK
jgi:NAD-dependent deacetylase